MRNQDCQAGKGTEKESNKRNILIERAHYEVTEKLGARKNPRNPQGWITKTISSSGEDS